MMTGPGWFLQRMWWRGPWRHLSEDRLLVLALGTTGESARTAAAAACHLRTCRRCEGRFSALTTLLKTMPEVAEGGFEEVFTAQRLQTQRARIGHRLAQLVGKVAPVRVLAFPFCGRPHRQVDRRPVCWLATATAVGLLLGVTAGQLIHYQRVATRTATAAETADDAPRSAAAVDEPAGRLDMTGTVDLPPPDGDSQTQASQLTLGEFVRLMEEEEFLGNLELALASFQVSELESIDALTPRVRDLSINIR